MALSKPKQLARAFATELQTTLNRTIADDAIILAGLNTDDDTIVLGSRLGQQDFKTRPIPLLSRSRDCRCWMEIQQKVYVNPEGYLTTKNSYIAVTDTDDESVDPFFHYDYERDKAGYTEAHLQVFGRNERLEPVMETLCTVRDKKLMADLHFPVGGRRFRPTLEDVIEFLIDEQLVEPKTGAGKALKEGRDKFRMIQLRAMVRDHPDVAAAMLGDLNYRIEPPKMPKQRRPRGTLRRTFGRD